MKRFLLIIDDGISMLRSMIKESLIKYLNDVFGMDVDVRHPERCHGDGYTILDIHILDNDIRSIYIDDDIEIESIISEMKRDCTDVTLVKKEISSRERIALRKEDISYIIPNEDIYIPSLGIDLNEKHIHDLYEDRYDTLMATLSRYIVRQPRNENVFSPETQCVFLDILYRYPGRWVYPKNITDDTGIDDDIVRDAFMRMSALSCARIERDRGDLKICMDGDRKSIFESALDKLISPIKKICITECLDGCPGQGRSYRAGESALAGYSPLSPPRKEIFACHAEVAADMESPMVVHTSRSAVLEIWHYDPAIFAVDGLVDPISLILSFKNDMPLDPRLASCCYLLAYACLEKNDFFYATKKMDIPSGYEIRGAFLNNGSL